jgi:hypothetical protein
MGWGDPRRMEPEKPSTRHLVLKHKEVVLTDERACHGDGTAISVQLMHEQNRVADQKAAARKKTGDPFPDSSAIAEEPLAPVFKPKEIALTDPKPFSGDEEAIHIPEFLLENRIAEENSGWGRIKHWRRRRSRRDRDFIVAVGGVDLAIIILMRVMPGEGTLVFGLSGITLFTTMSAWIMYMVMDDY